MSLYHQKYRVESSRLKEWDYGSAAAYFITICTKHRAHWFGEIRVETPCLASPEIIQPSKCNLERPCLASMQLSEIGSIVYNEWLKTPEMRPDMNLMLDEFVVMPNHFHAIIFIGGNDYNHRRDAMPGVSEMQEESQVPITMPGVSEMQDESPVHTARQGISKTGSNGMITGDARHGEIGDARHGVSKTGSNGAITGDARHGVIGDARHGISKTGNNGTITGDARHGVSTGKIYGPQSKNLGSIIRGFKSAVTMQARKINPDFAWQERYHEHIIRDQESLLRINNYITNNPSNWKEDKFFKETHNTNSVT